MEGLIRHLVMYVGDKTVYLPCRNQNLGSDKIERSLFGFKSDDLLNIGEDLEIIHPGLGSESTLEITDGFLRGNTISWAELERGYDVKFEMYPGFLRKVVAKLDDYTNETLELSHKPGAGGTTVARRLAWDLHREFPCAVLRKYSDSTAGRIAALYRLTHLPVLLIIEAGILTVPDRERLYKAVRDENARAVFVYVKRTYDGSAKYQVPSPLSNFESGLFLKKYAQQDNTRMENITRLAHDDNLMPYRMPFFFGLYAFEENFTHVSSYVEAHLSELSEQSKTLLRFIALVSRFSQYPISQSILAAIAGIDDTSTFTLNTILGNNAAKLVIRDSHSGKIAIRIIHPLIAEHILKFTISKVDWTKQLESLSCDFTNKIADVCNKDAEEVLDLVTQIFIQREYWSDGKRSFFAQIIQLIPNAHGQAKVLKTLTERFPQESHFWNHRGRHSSRILKEDYHEAETFLNNAIRLSPLDPLHHHALGMIYREEVKKILKEKFKPKDNNIDPKELNKVRGEIESLYLLAEDSFSKVRKLNPDNEHGYVANVQMIFSVIESMRNISGQMDYPSFFRANTGVMAWLRSNLEKAKELLDEIIYIQGKDKSGYVSNYSAQYRGLLGDYDAMISGLNELLAKTENDKSSLRRLITDCIRNHHQDNWQKLTNKNLERVRDLAMENIDAGEANHRDFINWLHSYRRLPGFDFNEVISIMENWSTYGDALQAHYYLFIFHFIKWYKGLTTDTSNIRRHLDKINKTDSSQKWSHEWLAKFDGNNACGLVAHNELGIWAETEDGHKFFDQHDSLLRITGVVTDIKTARSGIITIYSTGASQASQGKMEAFFVPGTDFIKGRDESSIVNAYIGFSYNGLRAWMVSRK